MHGTVSVETSNEPPRDDQGFERRHRRVPLWLLGIVVVGGFTALGVAMFSRSVVYYRTPTEVLAHPGDRVRIEGTVVTGSIDANADAGTLTFSVTDATSTVLVRYRGGAPNSLRDGGQAVAEGALGSDGVFHADRVFARCPSKFQGKTPGP